MFFNSHIIYLILFSIYFFYPSLVSIIIKLFLYFLSFYLVRILSSFLFHSSSFFPVFAIFIRFALQMSPLWASSTCHYFQFYPYWPFKNHPRRTPRSSEPSAKLKSLFPLLLYTLFLFTLRYFLRTFNGSPFPEPHEGLRYTHFLLSFNARFTCWRRSDTSSSPSPMLFVTDSTSY